MNRKISTTAAFASALFVAGCATQSSSQAPAANPVASTSAPAPSSPAPEAASPAPAASTDQVALGAKLYADNCAHCHGDAGEGGKKSPPVVGPNALPLNPPATAKGRKGQFHTALDVALFVKDNMPPDKDKAAALTLDQYFAILAFDLKANGVDVTGKTIDAKAAQAIVLHP